MFGRKTGPPSSGEGQVDVAMNPSAWNRREQENDGQWTSFFLDLTAKEERYPSASPPIGSPEHTVAEDASLLHTYWIGYWSGIVANYDAALQKIDAEIRLVVMNPRMSEKAKSLCKTAGNKHRHKLEERRAGFLQSLSKAVAEGEGHLKKAISQHHRALEAALREHREDDVS